MKSRFSKLITTLFLLVATSSFAQDCDTMRVSLPNGDGSSMSSDTIVAKPKGVLTKFLNYFKESNKGKSSNRIDFSVIGGPHYSSDEKFGIGLVAAGLYRSDLSDSISPMSDVSIYADGTTSMRFKLGIRGNHIFSGDKSRLIYDINFASISTQFWGIGYDMAEEDDNECDFKYLAWQARVNHVWRLCDCLFLGPMLTVDYINGRHFERPELWQGQEPRTFNIGIGVTLQYDTRDFLPNAYRGVYLRLDQSFNPNVMGKGYNFGLTELTAAWYHRVWSTATLAMQAHGRVTYGNTPWGLLSTLGGSHTMRGYFEGRYRDKSEIDCCVELRQHIWRRSGVVAWVGAGTIFPKFADLRWKTVLPNYGVGYRWEFKKRVNVRFDVGFGRGQSGFLFSINEAF